ncbi:MAG: di-heme oxidoredictase family protein, partial [Gemmatimonadaceae bacterium]
MYRTRLSTCAIFVVLFSACSDRTAPTISSPDLSAAFSNANDNSNPGNSSSNANNRDNAADRFAALIARTALSGGSLTVFDATINAFSLPSPDLSASELAHHDLGDGAFDTDFVPGAAAVGGGLGPVFDNVSCTGCHVGDGRGRPPVNG